MKVVMLMLVGLTAVAAQVCGGPGFKCCIPSTDPDFSTCPTDPDKFDGNCCPTSKSCCNIQVGNTGSGVWTCCAGGLSCSVSSPGQQSCAAVAPPPTAVRPPTPAGGKPPTPAAGHRDHCPFPDTDWTPEQECYTGWEGNCGEGNYCVKVDATVNPTADGVCCKKNKIACKMSQHCGSCVANGCSWIESGAGGCQMGCQDTCDTTLPMSACYNGTGWRCPAEFPPQYLQQGTCFRRCTADYELGQTEYNKRVAAGTGPSDWKGTGYPALGPPAKAGMCSCDDDCYKRTVNGFNDCCADRDLYCGLSRDDGDMHDHVDEDHDDDHDER